MIFVTSDLHGYPLADFKKLLRRAGFTDYDFLFILGDVIDRGENGAELLLWMTEQPNVELILGNHEAMLLSCELLFEAVTDESLSRLDMEQISVYQNWISNGGGPTVAGLRRILSQDEDLFWGIFDYLRESPFYDTVRVDKRNYVLVHSGLANFSPNKPLNAYSPDDFLWNRPDLNTYYYDNSTVVFGHTPTDYYGEENVGKAVHTASWICIDTGAAHGGKPMILCLDDLREIY